MEKVELITGTIINAKIKLKSPEEIRHFRKRMRQYCADKMEYFKIPRKVVFCENDLHSARFKKMRNETNNNQRQE